MYVYIYILYNKFIYTVYIIYLLECTRVTQDSKLNGVSQGLWDMYSFTPPSTRSTSVFAMRTNCQISNDIFNSSPSYPLLGTNILSFFSKHVWGMMFLFPRWDMLVPWRFNLELLNFSNITAFWRPHGQHVERLQGQTPGGALTSMLVVM